MSRNLTAAAIAEIKSRNLRPMLLCEIQFVSGISRLWTGYGTLRWNNLDWLGVGILGQITAMQEISDVSAAGVTLSLSGIPLDVVGKALNEVRQGDPATIWQGFLDANNNVVADPAIAWKGRLDTCSIDEGSDSSTVSLTVESRLLDLQRSRELDYDTQDQVAAGFTGDLGFDYVPGIQQLSLVWGTKGIPGATQAP